MLGGSNARANPVYDLFECRTKDVVGLQRTALLIVEDAVNIKRTWIKLRGDNGFILLELSFTSAAE